MSKETTGSGVRPLPLYDGPTECYAIDPSTYPRPRNDEGLHPTDHYIHTSLIIDDYFYLDAVRVYVDDIEAGQPFYLDIHNARALVEMLQRDIAKLQVIDAVDPL